MNMIIGKEYEFISDSDREAFNDRYSNNKAFSNMIIKAGGKFTVKSGSDDNDSLTSEEGKDVRSVDRVFVGGKYHSVHNFTLISSSETKYFKLVEAEITPDQREKMEQEQERAEFGCVDVDRLVAIVKHQNPNISDSKITLSMMRTAYRKHKIAINVAKENLKLAQERLATLEAL